MSLNEEAAAFQRKIQQETNQAIESLSRKLMEAGVVPVGLPQDDDEVRFDERVACAVLVLQSIGYGIGEDGKRVREALTDVAKAILARGKA